MFGDDIQDLKVLIRQYKDSNYKATSVWSKSGGQNDVWNRAEVSLTSSAPFQVKCQNMKFVYIFMEVSLSKFRDLGQFLSENVLF